MSETALRSRSVSELVDATFTLYRRHASAYIMVTALAMAPGLVAELLLNSAGDGAAALVGRVIYVIITLVSYSLMTGVVMKVGSDVYLGGEPDVAAAVRAIVPKIGTLVATAIIKGVTFFLYALLLVFPVFIAMAKYFAPEAGVVLEDKDSSEAMKRSAELSDGLRMHIFKTLLLGYIIYFVLFISVGLVSAMVQNEVLVLVVTKAAEVIAYPIVALLTMLLYFDCRIRKEGFDMEHLERSLGEPSAAGRPLSQAAPRAAH